MEPPMTTDTPKGSGEQINAIRKILADHNQPALSTPALWAIARYFAVPAPDAVEAVARAIAHAAWERMDEAREWDDLDEDGRDSYRHDDRAALSALPAQRDGVVHELTDVEAEAALTSEGIYVWGPDGERFERMFNVVMSARKTAPAGGGE